MPELPGSHGIYEGRVFLGVGYDLQRHIVKCVQIFRANFFR
jgi:hypothetical protein